MRIFSAFILLILVVPSTLLSQDYKQIAEGIEYAEILRGTEKEPIRANLLRLDLAKVRLDVVHAMDAAIGLETPSSIAKRHGAIAAINAGFFNMNGLFSGDPVGILQIDGKLLSESYGRRITLLINNLDSKTEVEMEHRDANFGLFPRNIKAKISGINRERKKDELILYTPEFHRTTLTNNDGIEIVVDKENPKNKFSTQRITKIIVGKGSSLIPENGYIFSAVGKSMEALKNLKVGDKFLPTKEISYPKESLLNKGEHSPLLAEDAIAGVPQLLKNGKIDIPWEKEKTSKSFVETKHPRTAVAKLKDGKFLMITVDGRQPNHSVGIGLQELAEMLLEIGATDAMNLDGGGSTTMFLNGETKNKPSDKEGERKVSDVILVTLRKK